MAFAMTTQGQGAVTAAGPVEVPMIVSTSTGLSNIQLADQTFTTTRSAGTAQTLLVGCTKFRLVIYLKTLVLGANTGIGTGPLFYLEVADNSGMSTNLTALGPMLWGINIASSTEVQCLTSVWMTTPVTAKAYVRVIVDPTLMGAGSSGTFDAMIECTP